MRVIVSHSARGQKAWVTQHEDKRRGKAQNSHSCKWMTTFKACKGHVLQHEKHPTFSQNGYVETGYNLYNWKGSQRKKFLNHESAGFRTGEYELLNSRRS